jgi:hypothetical protein
MISGPLRFASDRRSISPAIGVALMVVILALLAVTTATLMLGFTGELESVEEVDLYDDSDCPGFRAYTYEPPNFDDVQSAISENNCALWLNAGDVDTDGSNRVTRWSDSGQNGFHATQSTAGDRPTLIPNAVNGQPAVDFDGNNQDTNNPSETNGEFLRLDRTVDDLNIDEDTGLAVIAVLKVDEFNRGGTWTIGQAGQDGREFSMRTCSSYSVDGCQFGDPSGQWRAQHFGVADVDFASPETDDQWAILVHSYDGQQVQIRINGETVATESAALDLATSRDIQLGRWERTPEDPNWYFDGQIAELLIFDQTLDTEDIENVESYLDTKFDIT